MNLTLTKLLKGRKPKKIFLLTEKESWRIFIFHSTNSFIVTHLGITKIICSMLESKRICVSLLHLFNFIDIDSFTLEPLPTSFLNLEFFIVLRSSVKKWPWFSSTKFYLLIIIFYYGYAVCDTVLCVNNGRCRVFTISEFTFSCFFNLCTTKGASSIFNLLGKRVCTLSKWEIELMFRIFCHGKY